MASSIDQLGHGKQADVCKILEQHDAYILGLARRKVPRHIAPPETLDLEVDELAQKIRIKLWLALRKESIECPKAYIRCIVRSESIDMVRRYKAILPLPIDEDGELCLDGKLFMQGEGMQNPLDQIEQEESMAAYLTEAVEEVISLPPCQQRAMISALKDQVDDVHALTEAFQQWHVNIETVKWPTQKRELQKSRASLSIARKRLRSLKKARQKCDTEAALPNPRTG